MWNVRAARAAAAICFFGLPAKIYGPKNAPTFIGAFCFYKSGAAICRSVLAGVPIDDVPEGFQEVGALVLVFEIVGVFPDVTADDGLAFAAGDGFAHERIVLVRRGDNLQLAVV